ncbi:MAG: M4 family metallopeptidase [Acidobacteriota bacterium]
MRKRILLAALACLVTAGILAAVPPGLLPGNVPMPGSSRVAMKLAAARTASEAAAAGYMKSHGLKLGYYNSNVNFNLRRTVVDPSGTGHVRYRQTFKGLPVFGADVVVHVNNQLGGVFAVTNRSRILPDMSVKPGLGAAAASAAARLDFVRRTGERGARTTAVLVIYPQDGAFRLAYEVNVSSLDVPGAAVPADRLYMIDARSGSVLASWNNLHTQKPSGAGGGHGGGNGGGGGGSTYSTPATGSGNTLYLGAVPLSTAQASDGSSSFALLDPTRGSDQTNDMAGKTHGSGTLFTNSTDSWGDGTTYSAESAAADAHFGTEMTWDFYKNTFGRTGIYNDGKGSYSRVHYGRNYNNAFWSDSCKCMTYGDGESGGLNESFSDIMGTGVEFYAAAHGAHKTPNYWIGEDVYTPGTSNDALRYMDDPTRDGSSIDNYANYTSSLDVHYSSGIWNNCFYLMAHGGTNGTSGIKVSGMGIDKALAVCYLANTSYFTSGETFHQARLDCIAAAQQLQSQGQLTSTDVNVVAQAWTAVGVN